MDLHTAKESPAAWLRQREQFARLLDKFTLQVQTGCNNALCTTPTCFTYRKRQSSRPIRKYNALAASSIALVLAGRNDAAAFICPHLPLHPKAASLSVPDRIDAKALTQRLSCTNAVRESYGHFITADISSEVTQQAQSSPGPIAGLPSCVRLQQWSLERADFLELQVWGWTSPELWWLNGASPQQQQVVKAYLQDIVRDPDRILSSFQALGLTATNNHTRDGRSSGVNCEVDMLLRILIETMPTTIFDNLSYTLRRLALTGDSLQLIYICINAIGLYFQDNATWIVSRSQPDQAGEFAYKADEVSFSGKRSQECALEVIAAIHRLVGPRSAQAAPHKDNTSLDDVMRMLSDKAKAGMALDNPVPSFLIVLRSIVPELWDGKHFVERKSPLWEVLYLLQKLHDKQETTAVLPHPITITTDGGLDLEAACTIYLTSEGNGRHILSWTCLHGPDQQWNHFRTACYIRMRDSTKSARQSDQCRRHFSTFFDEHNGLYSAADKMYLDSRTKVAASQFLVLRVSRDDVLKDAFDQLWQREHQELLRPLRVQLGEDLGEQGQDHGGVQIEFFSLVSEQLCSPMNPFFEIDPETNLMWFRPGSLEPLYRFELLGLLFGLAVHNGINLPVSFPVAFYRKLMGYCLDRDDLQERWPGLYRSLVWIGGADEKDIDDMGLEHTFAVMANGVTLTADLEYHWRQVEASRGDHVAVARVWSVVMDEHHPRSPHRRAEENGKAVDYSHDSDLNSSEETSVKPLLPDWPGWMFLHKEDGASSALTFANRDAYVSGYAKWILDYSIRPQWYAFARGFFHVIDLRALHLVSPHNLRELVEGRASFTASDLATQMTYDRWQRDDPQPAWLRDEINTYSQEKLLRLLEFVTASKRLPPKGAPPIRFVVEKQRGAEPGSLPSSQTCFGILHLPDYKSQEELRVKMNIALELGTGFGLA